MIKRILDFLFGHKWGRVPFAAPELGDPEWGISRYGGALTSLGGLSIRRRCKRCGLVQEQTDRIWTDDGLTFKAVWTDVPGTGRQ